MVRRRACQERISRHVYTKRRRKALKASIHALACLLRPCTGRKEGEFEHRLGQKTSSFITQEEAGSRNTHLSEGMKRPLPRA